MSTKEIMRNGVWEVEVSTMQGWLSFISLFLFYSVTSHRPGMEPSAGCQCYWDRPRSFFLLVIFFNLIPVSKSLTLLNIIPLYVLWLWPFHQKFPEIMIFKQADMQRIGRGSLWTCGWVQKKSKGERDLVDGRLAPFSMQHTGSVLLSWDH